MGRKLQFPEAVLSTTLKLYVITWSPRGKKIIMVELTVRWEEVCEEAAERKKTKYQQLVQDCQEKGLTTWLFAVEVRCRGFPAQSVRNLLTKVGVRGHKRKTAAQRCLSSYLSSRYRQAEQSSFTVQARGCKEDRTSLGPWDQSEAASAAAGHASSAASPSQVEERKVDVVKSGCLCFF
eukprot:superscaffoldBa00000582_g5799